MNRKGRRIKEDESRKRFMREMFRDKCPVDYEKYVGYAHMKLNYYKLLNRVGIVTHGCIDLDPKDIVHEAFLRILRKEDPRIWNMDAYPTAAKFLRSVIRSIITDPSRIKRIEKNTILSSSYTDTESMAPYDDAQESKEVLASTYYKYVPGPLENLINSDDMLALEDFENYLLLNGDELAADIVREFRINGTDICKNKELALAIGATPNEIRNGKKRIRIAGKKWTQIKSKILSEKHHESLAQ